MFEDNWFLFLLIIMAVFVGDGNFSDREIAVTMAILFALTITNDNSCSERVDVRSSENCFCNR